MAKAIVTGHTQGLGAGIAASLMARGIAVLGLARRASPTLAARYPGLLREEAIDLADSAALAAWLGGAALRDFLADAGLVLLVNNAGSLEPVGALQHQDPMAVAQAVALNVTAPLMLAAALAKHRAGVDERDERTERAERAGPVAGEPAQLRILHVSSGAARNAYAGWSVYCASKAALDHHARAVAQDAVEGVRICSLAPGVIDTDMQARIRATPAERFPGRERFAALHREGRLMAPQAAAERVVDYLLSPAFGDKPVDDVRA